MTLDMVRGVGEASREPTVRPQPARDESRYQHEVFVFGPRDDGSEAVMEPSASPIGSDPTLLSPITVRPAAHPVQVFVTAPTPPTSSSSSSARPTFDVGPDDEISATPMLSTSTPNGGLDHYQLRPTSLHGQTSDGGPRRSGRPLGRNRTISGVTEEARKVLEQFLLRSLSCDESDAAAMAERRTRGRKKAAAAEVTSATEVAPASALTPQDGDDEPDGLPRPLSSTGEEAAAAAGVDGSEPRPSTSAARPTCFRDSMAMPEDDATSHSPVSGPNSLYSFSSRSSSNRNRIHQVKPLGDDKQLKKAMQQQQQQQQKQRNRKKNLKKKKNRRLARQHSTSSSSSAEYEIVEGQLRLRRKKPSLITRAKERIRQSFRLKKKPAFDPYSIDDDEIREAQEHNAADRRSFPPNLRTQRSDKSRWSTDRSPTVERDFPAPPQTLPGRCPVHSTPGAPVQAGNGAALLPNGGAPPLEKEKNRNIFENLLHSIRKGPGKLRRKSSQKESTGPLRSRSAEALAQFAVQRRDDRPPPPPPSAGGPSSHQHRKAGSHDEASLHRVMYCRCHSTEGVQPAPPPPTPPLPSASQPSRLTAPTRQGQSGAVDGRQRSPRSGQHRLLTVDHGRRPGPSGPTRASPADLAAQDLVGRAALQGLPQSFGLPTAHVVGEDEVDSISPRLRRSSHADQTVNKPFAQKTDAEKDELYEKIAEQLSSIADNYNLESPRSLKHPDLFFRASDAPTVRKSASAPVTAAAVASPLATASFSSTPEASSSTTLQLEVPPSGTADGAARSDGHTPIELKIGKILRDKGDKAAGDLSDFEPVVAELIRNASYSRFQQIIHENVGTEPGWHQVALVFNLTRSAVQLAGLGTAAALQIKELTLRYFEDRFASWIVGQGGWESMVEDDLSSEVD